METYKLRGRTYFKSLNTGSNPALTTKNKSMELNEHGLKVWKHKTNKRLFLEQSYRWKDSLLLLDETEERQIVDIFKASTFNYSSWKSMTQEEYDSVKSKFAEIYK
jgi:hypothetical protein